MDLITGTSSPAHDEPPGALDDVEVEADATPGGTQIPELHGPAAEPVDAIRAGGAGRWIAGLVPAVGGAAAICLAVLRARRH